MLVLGGAFEVVVRAVRLYRADLPRAAWQRRARGRVRLKLRDVVGA
jgi:hypothetical protein